MTIDLLRAGRDEWRPRQLDCCGDSSGDSTDSGGDTSGSGSDTSGTFTGADSGFQAGFDAGNSSTFDASSLGFGQGPGGGVPGVTSGDFGGNQGNNTFAGDPSGGWASTFGGLGGYGGPGFGPGQGGVGGWGGWGGDMSGLGNSWGQGTYGGWGGFTPSGGNFNSSFAPGMGPFSGDFTGGFNGQSNYGPEGAAVNWGPPSITGNSFQGLDPLSAMNQQSPYQGSPNHFADTFNQFQALTVDPQITQNYPSLAGQVYGPAGALTGFQYGGNPQTMGRDSSNPFSVMSDMFGGPGYQQSGPTGGFDVISGSQPAAGALSGSPFAGQVGQPLAADNFDSRFGGPYNSPAGPMSNDPFAEFGGAGIGNNFGPQAVTGMQSTGPAGPGLGGGPAGYGYGAGWGGPNSQGAQDAFTSAAYQGASAGPAWSSGQMGQYGGFQGDPGVPQGGFPNASGLIAGPEAANFDSRFGGPWAPSQQYNSGMTLGPEYGPSGAFEPANFDSRFGGPYAPATQAPTSPFDSRFGGLGPGYNPSPGNQEFTTPTAQQELGDRAGAYPVSNTTAYDFMSGGPFNASNLQQGLGLNPNNAGPQWGAPGSLMGLPGDMLTGTNPSSKGDMTRSDFDSRFGFPSPNVQDVQARTTDFRVDPAFLSPNLMTQPTPTPNPLTPAERTASPYQPAQEQQTITTRAGNVDLSPSNSRQAAQTAQTISSAIARGDPQSQSYLNALLAEARTSPTQAGRIAALDALNGIISAMKAAGQQNPFGRDPDPFIAGQLRQGR